MIFPIINRFQEGVCLSYIEHPNNFIHFKFTVVFGNMKKFY